MKKKVRHYKKQNKKLLQLLINLKKDEMETLDNKSHNNLTKLQNAYLEHIPRDKSGDMKFVNCMLQMVFSTDVLVNSSITGVSRSGKVTDKLDIKKLKKIEGKLNLHMVRFHDWFESG